MIRTLPLFLILLMFPTVALSAVGYLEQPVGTVNLPSSPSALIASLIAYTIGIVAILGVIGITWGGIQMIISAGEDEKYKKARYMIIYSIVGVILAGLAYGIVTVISSLKI